MPHKFSEQVKKLQTLKVWTFEILKHRIFANRIGPQHLESLP